MSVTYYANIGQRTVKTFIRLVPCCIVYNWKAAMFWSRHQPAVLTADCRPRTEQLEEQPNVIAETVINRVAKLVQLFGPQHAKNCKLFHSKLMPEFN